MNIPPFTNSHSLYEQQTVIVDRATLFPQSTCLVVDDDKLTQLDELLKANLGGLDVPDTRKQRKHTGSGEGQSALHETFDPARKSGSPFTIVQTGVSQPAQHSGLFLLQLLRRSSLWNRNLCP